MAQVRGLPRPGPLGDHPPPAPLGTVDDQGNAGAAAGRRAAGRHGCKRFDATTPPAHPCRRWRPSPASGVAMGGLPSCCWWPSPCSGFTALTQGAGDNSGTDKAGGRQSTSSSTHVAEDLRLVRAQRPRRPRCSNFISTYTSRRSRRTTTPTYAIAHARVPGLRAGSTGKYHRLSGKNIESASPSNNPGRPRHGNGLLRRRLREDRRQHRGRPRDPPPGRTGIVVPDRRRVVGNHTTSPVRLTLREVLPGPPGRPSVGKRVGTPAYDERGAPCAKPDRQSS